MEQRILGATGIPVSVLGFGAMNLGPLAPVEQSEADRMVGEALDAGVTLFDTADLYNFGESERMLGKALGKRRADIVLTTKGRHHTDDVALHGGASRRWITRAVDNSLRRLGTDYIDVYQIHRPDWDTPVEETLSVLTDLQKAGKILHFGTSTYPAYSIVEGQCTAKEHGLSRFVTEQVAYSIFQRSVEADVFPVTQRHNMGVLVWSPLANGWLAGNAKRGEPATTPRAKMTVHEFDYSTPAAARKFGIVDELTVIAKDLGVSLAELGLAFAKHHRAVTSVLMGPRTIDQLRQDLKAADLVLDNGTLDRIDAIVAPGTDTAREDRYEIPDPLFADPTLRRRS